MNRNNTRDRGEGTVRYRKNKNEDAVLILDKKDYLMAERGQLDAEHDLDRHKMSFLSEQDKKDAKDIKERNKVWYATDKHLKYKQLSKIETKATRLQDYCLLGDINSVKRDIEENNADMNAVNGDLETPLDLARKGKKLMIKNGHAKTAHADHDSIIAYLVQKGAFIYEEVVLDKKRIVEETMKSDKERERNKIVYSLFALFVLLCVIIGRAAHIYHSDDKVKMREDL